jgi:hypothetical protein
MPTGSYSKRRPWWCGYRDVSDYSLRDAPRALAKNITSPLLAGVSIAGKELSPSAPGHFCFTSSLNDE